jgi:hypothetical protein
VLEAVIGIPILIAVGLGAIFLERSYWSTAEAYPCEGRRTTAAVTGGVTYWRRGAVLCDPSQNRYPWNPDGCRYFPFGWICACPSFLGAILLLIRALMTKPKKPGSAQAEDAPPPYRFVIQWNPGRVGISKKSGAPDRKKPVVV